MVLVTLNSSAVNTLRNFWPMCGTMAIYTAFYALGFRLFHTYAGVIRYSSFVDLLQIGLATLFGLTLSLIFRFTVANVAPFIVIPGKDLFYMALGSVLLICAVRVVVKFLFEWAYQRAGAAHIYIFGVKEGGISIAKSIRNQSPANYILAGFVSDKHDLHGRMLMGVKVHPLDKSLPEQMKQDGASALFVSPLKSEALRENEELVDGLIEAGIKIFMVPAEQPWDGKSDIHHQQLREVSIEDLLPRDPIDVDMAIIARQLRGKRILITGAAGSIGSEIVKQTAALEPQSLILIDQAETPLHDIRLFMAQHYPHIQTQTIVADIVAKGKMEQIFKLYQPQYVFHAAAYKHVPMMEDNPGESVHNNVEGTRVLADLSVKYDVEKFVMISTDKAVNPTNVMGASKRICEIYVQSLDKAIKDRAVKGKTQFVTTRFGNVLGSNGSVIPLFRRQIQDGGPITVTHPDIIRYFMLIPEACKLVLEAASMGNGGEIFVFDMGKPVKIVDLARRMIQLSGAKIDIKFTGLRQGEKLYEEVLNEQEKTLETFHPKIRIAKVRQYEYREVARTIEDLVEQCFRADAMTVVAMMKKIVPEFVSKNSVYSRLDIPAKKEERIKSELFKTDGVSSLN